jgi:hypothetical protein
MSRTATAPLRHVPAQFATRTVDPTGLRDRTAPAQKPTGVYGGGARRIAASTQQESNVTQQIVAQYLMLVGK